MVNHLIKFLLLLQYMVMNKTTNGGSFQRCSQGRGLSSWPGACLTKWKAFPNISRSCWMDVHSCHFVARPNLSLVPAQYTNATRRHADKHSIRASRHEQLTLYVSMIIRYSFRSRWVFQNTVPPVEALALHFTKAMGYFQSSHLSV